MRSIVSWFVLLGCAAFAFSAAVSCGGDSNSGAPATGTGGASGTTANTPCLRACATLASACGDPGCSVLCSVLEQTYNVAQCSNESKAYFDCVTSLQTTDFKCGADAGEISIAVEVLIGGSRSDKCDSSYRAFMQCNLTEGKDCAPVATFDASCSVTDNAHPHFQYCKLDVSQPAGCVEYVTGSAGWYCCE